MKENPQDMQFRLVLAGLAGLSALLSSSSAHADDGHSYPRDGLTATVSSAGDHAVATITNSNRDPRQVALISYAPGPSGLFPIEQQRAFAAVATILPGGQTTTLRVDVPDCSDYQADVQEPPYTTPTNGPAPTAFAWVVSTSPCPTGPTPSPSPSPSPGAPTSPSSSPTATSTIVVQRNGQQSAKGSSAGTGQHSPSLAGVCTIENGAVVVRQVTDVSAFLSSHDHAWRVPAGHGDCGPTPSLSTPRPRPVATATPGAAPAPAPAPATPQAQPTAQTTAAPVIALPPPPPAVESPTPAVPETPITEEVAPVFVMPAGLPDTGDGSAAELVCPKCEPGPAPAQIP